MKRKDKPDCDAKGKLEEEDDERDTLYMKKDTKSRDKKDDTITTREA